MLNDITNRLLGGQDASEQLFRQKEYAAMLGYGQQRVLVWLTLIIVFTLAALAFALGSLERLDERMNNPFSNIIDLKVTSTERLTFDEITKELEDTELAGDLGIDTVVTWRYYNLRFLPRDSSVFRSLNNQDNNHLFYSGRTIGLNSRLGEMVFAFERAGEEARVFAEENLDRMDQRGEGGIVVTKRFLEELGYTDSKDVAALPVVHQKQVFFVPVIGVVKALPGRRAFASSPVFYQHFRSASRCGTGALHTNAEGDNNLYFIIPADQEDRFDKVLEAAQLMDEKRSVAFEAIATVPDKQLAKASLTLNIRAVEDSTYYTRLLEQLDAEYGEFGWQHYSYYQYPEVPCRRTALPQRYSFLFADALKVRDFSEWLLVRDIELPMEVVENQENFALVSLLGWFIGIILVLFAVLSIVFFIKNLVEGHLNQIKPNLGTFKAFGLPDDFLISMYSRIVTVLLGISLGIAIIIVALADVVLSLMQEEDTFSVWNLLLWGAIVLLFFSSLYFARRIIRNILDQTPGNLVYGRGNKG